MGGKITPRIRLTSAKDLVEVEVEAELGKNGNNQQRVFAKCFYHRLKGST